MSESSIFQAVHAWHKAAWINGKKVATGRWRYVWSADRFVVELASGARHVFAGDRPQWGNWKLQTPADEGE